MCQGDWSLTLIVIGAKDLKNVSTFESLLGTPCTRVLYSRMVVAIPVGISSLLVTISVEL